MSSRFWPCIQVQVLNNFQVVPSPLGSGPTNAKTLGADFKAVAELDRGYYRDSQHVRVEYQPTESVRVSVRKDLPGDLIIGHGLSEVALAHAHVEHHQRALPDQILALAFRSKPFKTFKLLHLRSEAL